MTTRHERTMASRDPSPSDPLSSGARLPELPEADEREWLEFVRQAPEMCVITGREQRFIQANPAWERHLGWTSEQLRAMRWPDLVHPADRERSLREAARLQDGGAPRPFENRYRTRDGQYRWLQWHLTLDREQGRVYAIVHDIDDRKRIEAGMVDEAVAIETFSQRLKLLHRLGTRPHDSLPELLDDYLEAGWEIFDLPLGVLTGSGRSRPGTERPEDERSAMVVRRQAPIGGSEREEVDTGERLDPEAWGELFAATSTTLGFADPAERAHLLPREPDADTPLPAAYLGTPITVDGCSDGILCFASARPRNHSFDRHDIELIELMAERIGRLLALDRAERARRRAQAERTQLAALVEQSSDFIALADPGGTTIYLNRGGADLLGLATPRDGVGLEIARYLHPADWRVIRDEAIPTALAGEVWEGDNRLRHFETDELVHTRASLFAVHHPDTSELLCLATVQRDVRPLLRAQQARRELLSTVSHELRTPLTAIHGALGLLAAGRAGELPEAARELVETAAKSGDALVRLAEDLLDFETLETGRLRLRVEPTAIRAVVERAVEANRPYARAFGVDLESAPGGADAELPVDPDRLHQVVTNLLSNAIKASPRGATVRVDLEVLEDSGKDAPDPSLGRSPSEPPGKSSEQGLRIAVRDRGPGIPEHLRASVFERFVQSDRVGAGDDAPAAPGEPRAAGGSGLGLPISRALVEAMGGSIHFDSRVGHGTTFYVDLPARTDA